MWDFNLALRLNSKEPLYLQISRGIAADISAGRLGPGDPLPGTRTLATQMGVHRNTIVSAYERLHSEGWVHTRPAGGTYVCAEVPNQAPRLEGMQHMAAEAAFAMPPLQGRGTRYPWQTQAPFGSLIARRDDPDVLFLANGLPDVNLFPSMALARAYRQVLREHASTTLDMGYDDGAGHPKVRRVLARMLATRRGIVATPEHTFTTRGTVMGLRLIAEALLAPGDLIAVEDPGYPVAWQAFTAAGANLVPVRVDAEGLVVSDLERVVQRAPLRAVYVTPHHQYPTTRVMSAARRLQLLNLAARHHFAIIEDDYDHVFHYEGQPVRPLCSGDDAGVVIYTASLSKLLAPGLRLGFVAAPKAFIDRLTCLRRHFDVRGDLTLELAIVALAEEGELSRHLRRARRVYVRRRDALVAALQRHMGDAVQCVVPKGGLTLWLTLAEAELTDVWAQRCGEAHKVLFHTSRRYSFGALPGRAARLCFANLHEDQLAEAARRMGQALDEVRRAHPRQATAFAAAPKLTSCGG